MGSVWQHSVVCSLAYDFMTEWRDIIIGLAIISALGLFPWQWLSFPKNYETR